MTVSYHLFPFDKVPKNSRIVLYGAGSVGTRFYDQVIKINFCEIVSWLDKKADGILVKEPGTVADLNTNDYDFVVIAIENETIALEVKASLINYGVPENKILHHVHLIKERYSTFTIETVLGCNLSCPECAVGGRYINRKYGMMPFERFVYIADKIKDHCKYMYLHNWGEPMLNPDIFKMIDYAKNFTKTNISTNANILTKDQAKMLIDSGVTDIIVSIDGVSQECYSVYRRGGKVKRALEALGWLAKLSISKKFKPNIIPQFVVFKHNENEMELFSQYCASLGLEPYFKPPYLREGTSLSLGNDPKYHRSLFYSDLAARKLNMKKCTNLTDVFTILLDGSVVSCCYDHNAVTTFGNILTQSFDEIINARVRIAFQQKLAAGDPPNFCIKNCLQF